LVEADLDIIRRKIPQAGGEQPDDPVEPDAVTGIRASYAREVTDEFVVPFVTEDYTGMAQSDGVFFLNFRADRAREILSAIGDPAFAEFDVSARPRLAALLGMVRRRFAGDRVGQTPPGTELPPIVDDVHREARKLKLAVDSIETKAMALDLYRSQRHRQVSRLFHQLDFLSVPFGRFVAGPDYVGGTGLDLLIEHWEVGWSPATEAALVEASIHGATVAEARDRAYAAADKIQFDGKQMRRDIAARALER